MPNEQYEYFASCPAGFERLLADELKRLRMHSVRPLRGGVAFFGSKTDGYAACLWSRLASRITRVIARVDASSADALYEQTKALPWEDFVGDGATIAVSARGTNGELRNTQFTAMKVKDAVCDALRDTRGTRPDVQPHRPDVPVWVSVHGNKATVSLDYAGESLHRRGYRDEGGHIEAPLKEALAAGMLVWAGWDHAASPAVRAAAAKRAAAEDQDAGAKRAAGKGHTTADEQTSVGAPLPSAPAFIDPTCGGGTLVLEAACMAADRAPGLSRDYWGFAGLADFDADAWDALLDDADERFERSLNTMPTMAGFDIDAKAVELAKASAKRLGFGDKITFQQADVADLAESLKQLGVNADDSGFIAMNPPYGIRLMKHDLDVFYDKLRRGLSRLGPTWKMVAITPDADFDTNIGFDAAETLDVYNGQIEATLRSYTLGQSFLTEIPLVTLDGRDVAVPVTSTYAEQFAARLRKMAKQRRSWAKKNGVNAYRIYDADLPDYAVAVDYFQPEDTSDPYVLIAEYQAPKEIDRQKAARRFKDACAVTKALFDLDDDRLVTRVRRQDKGGSQYGKNSGGQAADKDTGKNSGARSVNQASKRLFTVLESGHAFELNLDDYLDTGLFLDHRDTRSLVETVSARKSFLNLFAYTGSASVYAAAGGATSTTTVDMSQTYLDWAQRNMQRNGFTMANHRYIKADVLQWVEREAKRIAQADTPETMQYDLVFLDPPTFSNSKSMGRRTWDIQRDHAALLETVATLLAPGGTIVFSGNLRNFKLDEAAVEAAGLTAENITAQTIPEDFKRNPKIHFCYLLKK